MPIEPHDPEEFDRALSPPVQSAVEAAVDRRAPSARMQRIIRVVSGFLLGQGTAQGISVLAGLFLVRTLSVEAYAQFGVATAFQNVFSILMDLGFASTIIPLVGARVHDRGVVGRYVRAARHLRDRTFWMLAPIAAAAFLATVHRRHWSWHIQLLLLLSILVTLYSGGVVSFFSAALFLRGQLREYYLPQVFGGAGRLLCYIVLAPLRGLNAWTAAGLGALNITVNGALIRRSGMKYLDWPQQESAAADRELLRYVLPALPASIFSAFQSQISLFLISIFGGTLYIAQVAALSRIGQLFAVLTTFNTIVIEPYIARLSRPRLARHFVGFVLAATAACTPLVLIAFFAPQVFIWVIGSKYAGVSAEMGWYVLSACISFVAGLIWIMNRARKWVFWSGSIVEIVLVLTAQIAFVSLIGVRNTRQAVLFSLSSSCCVMIAHTYVTVRGFFQSEEAAEVEAGSV